VDIIQERRPEHTHQPQAFPHLSVRQLVLIVLLNRNRLGDALDRVLRDIREREGVRP